MRTGQLSGFEVSLDSDGIAIVRFNNPDVLNALTRAAKRDLIETLLQAQMDPSVRVVVFTGTGRAFVAGDDLDRERQAKSRPALMEPLPYGDPSPMQTYGSLRSTSQQVSLAMRHLDKMTIAAINGVAIQSGLTIALLCDWRIAADSARLGSGTLRYGFLPDEGGHYVLVEYLGVAGALDFLMRKRIVSAAEALQLGLVSRVVPDAEVMGEAMALARELANGPQVAMRLLKRAVTNAPSLTFEQSLDDIASKTAISDHHPDAREGRLAFHEKRAPRFNQWLERPSDRREDEPHN